MSHSPIRFYNMEGRESLSFHDVFLKVQGQLELLKRIHLHQVTGGCHDTDLGIMDLFTGKRVDQVHAGNGSCRSYGLPAGSSYSHDNVCSSGRESYNHGARNVDLFLEHRKHQEHQDQKTQLSSTELIWNIDRNNVNRKQMHDGDSDSAEGELTCLEGETIKMREINAAFCSKNHAEGDTMGIGKILYAGGEERKMIWNFRERRWESSHFHYQLGTVIDQKTGKASYQEDFHKTGTDERGTDGSEGNVRGGVHDRGHARVPTSMSFRRRKRKQESEKIHRTNCDSKLSGITGFLDNSRHSKSGIVGQELHIEYGMKGSLEQVRNNWTRVLPLLPTELDSKVWSDEELETTTREKGNAVGAGATRKSKLEATKGRECAFGHSVAASQNDTLCKHPRDQYSSGGKSEDHGSNRQNAIEPKPRLVGEATPELFVVDRSLACKAFACGTGEFSSGKVEHGPQKKDSIAKLEDSFTSQQRENKKLRIEITELKEQLESIMNFAEEGRRNKCTYCGSIKEKLKSIELYPELKTCGTQPTKELLSNMSESEKDPTAEVTETHGSPVGSCTNDKILLVNGLLSFEDDASLKRKRVFEQRSSGKGRDKKSKIQIDVSTMEGVPVQQKSKSEAMGTSFEWAPQICIRMSDFDQAQSSELPKPLVFEELISEESSIKNNKPGEVLSRQLKLHMEEERRLDLAANEEIVRDGSEVLTETQELHKVDPSTVKDEEDEEQRFNWLCDFQDLPEKLKKLAEKDNEEDFADLKCGCTSQKYGDTVGVLRVYKSGMLEIYCECPAGCERGKPMTPAAFERHGGRGASRKWKDSIWVILGDHKVQFSKVKGLDALYRWYKAMNNVRLTQAGRGRHGYHRDEFVMCKKCQKERRFRRRNKEECRLFHDALLNPTWECSNLLSDRFISCEDDEEREVRRSIRGCNRVRTCQGCIECVCLGCQLCRFDGCSCSICQEFMSYK